MQPPIRVPECQGIEFEEVENDKLWRATAFLGDEPVVLKLEFFLTEGWIGSIASPDHDYLQLNALADDNEPRFAAEKLADSLTALGLILTREPSSVASAADE